MNRLVPPTQRVASPASNRDIVANTGLALIDLGLKFTLESVGEFTHSVAAGIEDLGNPGNSEESMRLHRSVKPTQNRGSNTMPIPAAVTVCQHRPCDDFGSSMHP